MQLEFFSTWTQGKGNCPLPLQPIPKNKTHNRTNINPKNNTNINNKTEAVYTEGLTHPFAPSGWALLASLPRACAPSTSSGQALGCILSPLRGWVVSDYYTTRIKTPSARLFY